MNEESFRFITIPQSVHFFQMRIQSQNEKNFETKAQSTSLELG
jgi:hypothetical protein